MDLVKGKDAWLGIVASCGCRGVSGWRLTGGMFVVVVVGWANGNYHGVGCVMSSGRGYLRGLSERKRCTGGHRGKLWVQGCAGLEVNKVYP